MVEMFHNIIKKYSVETIFVASIWIIQSLFIIGILVKNKNKIASVHSWIEKDAVKNEHYHYKTEYYNPTIYLILALGLMIALYMVFHIIKIKLYVKMTGIYVVMSFLIFDGILVQMLYEDGKNLLKYIMFSFVGIAAMIITFMVCRREASDKVFRVVQILIGVCIAVILILVITRQKVNGSANWLRIGGISIQPSEILKILIIVLASYCYRYEVDEKLKKRFLLLAIASILAVTLANDFGSVAILCVITVVAYAYLFGKLTYALLASYCAVALGIIGTSVITWIGEINNIKWIQEIHALRRINSTFHVIEQGTGQQYNSMVNILYGGLSGLGIDNSVVATNVAYSYTDFVFNVGMAVYGIGFVITMVLPIIFLLVITFKTPVYRVSNNLMLVLGTLAIFCQAFIHIGSGLDMIPYTGIVFPLVSAGGSGIVMTYVNFGLILAGIATKMEQ